MALCLPGVAGGFDYADTIAAAPPLRTSSILPPIASDALPQLTASRQQRQDAYGGNILSRLGIGLQEQLRIRGEQLLTPDGLAATLDQGQHRDFRDSVADIGVQLTQSAIDGGLSQVEEKLLGNFVRSINLSFSPSLAGRETILQADSILSLYDSDQYALIGQTGLQSRSGEAAVNVGLAWRYRAVDKWVIGVNTFYDHLANPRVDRWSFGVEAKSHFVGVSANIYQGIGEERNGTTEHYSPDGWDMEVAGHLERLPWLEYSARYYTWNLLDSGDLTGSDYKLTVRPMPLLGISLRYDSPSSGDSEFGFETTFEYRFDLPFAQQKLFSNVATVGDVWERRFERVRREYEQRVQTRSLGPSGRQLGRCFSGSCSISFRNVPAGTTNLLLRANIRTGGAAGLVRAVPTSGSPSASGGVARNHNGNCHIEGAATATCSYDGASQIAVITNIASGSYNLGIDFRNAGDDVLGSTIAQIEISLPALSISGSTTVTEANNFSLSLSSDGPLASPITLAMSVSGGTAEAGDYVLPAAAITLAADGNAVNVPFTIVVNQDTDLDNETIELTFTLSGDARGVVAPAPITLNITDDDSAMLSSLAVSSGVLVPAFAPATTSYTLRVASDVRSVTLTPTAADADAMGITVNGSSVGSGSASSPITLPAGMTTQIQIVLTAEDGSTMLSYTIQVMAAAGPVLSVVASGSSVAEGGSVALNISSMGGAPSEAVTIAIAAQTASTASDSASGSIPADYSISATQVTLGADGRITPSSITIVTTDDMVDEGTGETIVLAYSLTAGASGASLAAASATITIQDNDVAGITVPSNVNVNLGNSSQFNVVLNSQPLFDVILNLASAATATATVSPASLNFTSANWNMPQAVTVNGVAGGTANIAFTISTNSQSRYSSTVGVVTAPSVAVQVIAPPTITVTPMPSDSVTEGSALTLQLAVSRAPSEQITMDVSVNTASTADVNDDYISMAASTVRVTIGTNGSVNPSSILISTINDSIVEVRETIILSYAVNAGGTGIVAPMDTTIYIDDNDSATLRVRNAPLSFNEAVGTATITIELTAALTSQLQVMVGSTDGTATAGASGDYTALSQTVTFAIGVTSQTVSLTINNDNIAESDETLQLTLASTTMPAELGTVISPATVTITDNDTRSIISTGGANLAVTEESTNSYTIVLGSQPTGTVTVAMTSADTGAATVAPAMLSFTTANWNTAQTVTVAGVTDADLTNESTTISYAISGGDYASVTLAAQTVTVTDNDVTIPTASIAVNNPAITEAGTGSATVTVTLSSAPTTATTVNLTSSGSATIGTGNDYTVATLAGTNPNYMLTVPANMTTATFMLTAVDDAVDDDDETAVFTVVAGTGYTPASGSAATVTVTITDDDIPPPEVSFTTATETVPEAGIFPDVSSAFVTIAFTGGALATIVNLSVSVDGTAVAADYTTGNSNAIVDLTNGAIELRVGTTSPVAFLILPTADTLTEGDETLIITLLDGDGYTVGSANTYTLTITNVAPPPPVASIYIGAVGTQTGTITEAGTGSATVTVTLSSAPTTATTVNLTSSGSATIGTGSDYTVATLAGTNPNYMLTVPANMTTATFTVTAVDDMIDENNETVIFTLATGGTGYTVGSAAAVTVTITDNDTRSVISSTGGANLAVTEESTNSYTIVLGSQPTGTVTVAMTSVDTGAATVSPATLSFSTANWNTAQTVTVTGVDDTDTTNESTTISYAVSGGDYAGVTLAAQTVTVNDNDIADITATAGAGSVVLTWTNPTNSNLSSVVVSATVNGAVVDINGATGGNDITIASAMSGASVNRSISGLTAAEHTFTIVAMDAGSTSIASGTATATPTAVTIGAPVVTVTPSATTVTEGSGAGNGGVVTLTLTLTNPPVTDVTVTVSRNGSSAAAASDYSLSAPTATLNATTLSRDITLTTTPDTVYEGDESLVLSYTVSGATGIAAVPDTTLTITEDDAQPMASVYIGVASTQTGTITEAGTSSTTVTVALSSMSGSATTVNLTRTGSATIGTGNDYTVATLAGTDPAYTLMVPALTSTATFTLTAVDDMIDDDAETAVFTIATGMGYAVASGGAAAVMVTITDNDTRSITSTGGANLAVTEESTNSYTIVLGSQPTGTVTVTMTSADTGAATVSPAMLSFSTSNWNTAQMVTVAGVTDADFDNESTTISYVISGGDYAGVTLAAQTVTVTDNDVPPEFSFPTATATVAESVGGSVTVNIAFTGGAPLTTAVNLSVSVGGTAVAADYTTGNGSANVSLTGDNGAIGIIVGRTSPVGFVISTTADTLTEGDETLLITLLDGDGYTVGSANTYTLTITEAAAPPEVSFQTATATAAEGSNAVVNIAFTGGASLTTGVDVSVSVGGTAVAADYMARNSTANVDNLLETNGAIAINAGRPSPVFFVIFTTADTLTEVDETVTITLLDGDGYTVGSANTYTLTITDVAPVIPSASIAVNNPTITEAGTGSATVTVTLSSAPTTATTVSLTRTGTATIASDYSVATLAGTDPAYTLTVPANMTTATFTVTAVDDMIDENNETVIFTLATGGTGYTVGSAAAVTVTITDNDTRSVISSTSGANLAVTEESTNSYTIVLGSQPTGTVTVAMTSADTGAATVAPATLSFTTANWNTAQTVTVAGVTDTDTTNESTTISYAVSGGDYAGVTLAAQTVTVNDNDIADITATAGAGSVVLTWTNPTNSNLSSVVVSATVNGAVVDLNGATGGNDITIASAMSGASVNRSISGLTAAEHTFTIVAMDAGSTSIASGTATATPTAVVIGAPVVTVTPSATSVTEGSGAGNGGVVTLTLTLTNPPATDVTVTVTRSTSSAAASDYSLSASTATLNATTLSRDITLTTTPDTVYEGDESIVLSYAVSGATGIAVVPDTTLTITEDDAAPVVTMMFASDTVIANGSMVTLTVGVNPGFTTATTLPFTISGGVAASDFSLAASTSGAQLAQTGLTGSLTIPVGSLSTEFRLTAVMDADTGNETLTLTLDGRSVAATISILAQQRGTAEMPVATVSANTNSVAEGGSVRVNVALAPAPTNPTTLSYSISGVDSADYAISIGTSGVTLNRSTLVVPAGIATVAIDFAINVNDDGGSSETMVFTMTGGSGYTLGSPSVANIAITEPVLYTIDTISPALVDGVATVAEGSSITIPVTVSGSEAGELRFSPRAGFGSVVAADYSVSVSGAIGGTVNVGVTQINVAAGVSAFNIVVTAASDNVIELSETIALEFMGLGSTVISGTGVVAGRLTLNALITDATTSATIRVTAATFDEAAGTANISLAIDRDFAASFASSIVVRLRSDDTAAASTTVATSSLDYAPLSSTVTFVPGGSRTFTVPFVILEDGIAEQSETVSIQASLENAPSSVGGRVTTSGATITITDNDDISVLSLGTVPDITEGGMQALTLNLSPAATADVMVQFTITGVGSNPAGTGDYSITGATVTIPMGMTTVESSSIMAVDDTEVEATEEFAIDISIVGAAGRVSLSDTASRRVGRIIDNDASGMFSISLSNHDDTAGGRANAIREGAGTVTATVSLPAAFVVPNEFTVQFSTAIIADGDANSRYNAYAASGNDFTAIGNRSLTFSNAAKSRTVEITIAADDEMIEGDEVFELRLSAATLPTGVSLPAAAAVRIRDRADVSLTIIGSSSINFGADAVMVNEGMSLQYRYAVLAGTPYTAGSSLTLARAYRTAPLGTAATGNTAEPSDYVVTGISLPAGTSIPVLAINSFAMFPIAVVGVGTARRDNLDESEMDTLVLATGSIVEATSPPLGLAAIGDRGTVPLRYTIVDQDVATLVFGSASSGVVVDDRASSRSYSVIAPQLISGSNNDFSINVGLSVPRDEATTITLSWMGVMAANGNAILARRGQGAASTGTATVTIPTGMTSAAVMLTAVPSFAAGASERSVATMLSLAADGGITSTATTPLHLINGGGISGVRPPPVLFSYRVAGSKMVGTAAGEILEFNEAADSDREIHLCLGSLGVGGRDTATNRPALSRPVSVNVSVIPVSASSSDYSLSGGTINIASSSGSYPAFLRSSSTVMSFSGGGSQFTNGSGASSYDDSCVRLMITDDMVAEGSEEFMVRFEWAGTSIFVVDVETSAVYEATAMAVVQNGMFQKRIRITDSAPVPYGVRVANGAPTSYTITEGGSVTIPLEGFGVPRITDASQTFNNVFVAVEIGSQAATVVNDFNIDGVGRSASVQTPFPNNIDNARPFLSEFRSTPYPNGASITVRAVDDSASESERETVKIVIPGYGLRNPNVYRAITPATTITITILDND